MEERDRRTLQVHRETLVDCIADVQPVLDGLISRCVLSPLSDDYQSVLAARTAREQTRLLLDILPTLGPEAFNAFVDSVSRYRPYLRELLEQDVPTKAAWASDGASADAMVDLSKDSCDLNKGPFAPARPSVELVSRVQRNLRKAYIRSGQAKAIVDFGPQKRGANLEEVCVTISSLSFDDVQAQIQETRTGSIGDGYLSKMDREMASKTFASRCLDEMELSDFGQLFLAANGEVVDSCLLVGPAGTGKSVLLDRILACWAEGRVKALMKFELVVYVNGRDEEVLRSKTAVGLLGNAVQRQCGDLSEGEKLALEDYMKKSSERILVVLDSADEGGEAWAKSKGLKNLFERKSLVGDCSFVVTSRPCTQAYRLVPWCSQRFYLIGLNDDRLDELLERRLGKEDGVCVSKSLKEPQRLNVRELMKKTPLVANMVARLVSGPARAKSLPRTTTEIYTSMALDMIRHERVKNDEEFGEEVMETFDDLPNEVQKMTQELGKLALDCLRQRRFVVDMRTVESACGKEAVDLGFLNKFAIEASGGGVGRCHKAEFRHLTWLEFFAAHHLCSQSGSPCAAVQTCAEVVGVGEETEPFWVFVSGLVKPKYLAEVLSSLRTAFFQEHRSAFQKRQWLWLSLRCVAEAAQQRTDSSSVALRHVGVETASAAVVPGRVELSNNRPSVADAQMLSISLQHSPHVKTLTMDECGLNAAHFTALEGGLSHVKELSLYGNVGLHGDGLRALVASLKQLSNPQLADVDMINCKLKEDDCAAIADLLDSVPSVHKLWLGLNYLGTAAVARLREPLIKSNVEVLDLSDCELDQGAGGVLGDVVQSAEHLRVMNVSDNDIGNDGVRDVLEGVTLGRSLEVVELTHTGVDDGVMDAVSACLSQRNARRAEKHQSESVANVTIHLHGNQISRGAVQEVARRSSVDCEDRVECDSLTVKRGAVAEKDYTEHFQEYSQQGDGGDLYMGHLGIGDSGAEQIASVLRGNRDVKSLNLGGNSVGDAGASSLGKALEVNTTLRGLSLNKNKVGNAGFVALTTSLTTHNRTLSVLCLVGNPVFSGTSDVEKKASREAVKRLVGVANSLRFLDLGMTGLGDAECDAIGTALTSDKCCLTFLGVAGNQISGVEVECLCSGLERNSTVQYIDLSLNQISNDGVERIGRCVESRADQGCPILQVWLEANRTDAAMLTGCMVDGQFAYPSPDAITNLIRAYS